MEPTLARQGSTIPVSLHQSETAVVNMPVSKAWSLFKNFKLEHIIPGKVKSSTFETGGVN